MIKSLLIFSIIQILYCTSETVYSCRERCDREYAVCTIASFSREDKNATLLPNVLICNTIYSSCYTKCGGTRSSSSTTTRY